MPFVGVPYQLVVSFGAALAALTDVEVQIRTNDVAQTVVLDWTHAGVVNLGGGEYGYPYAFAAAGAYKVRGRSLSTPATSEDGTAEVFGAGAPPTPADGPQLGPCTAWIDGADVAGCCSAAGVGSATATLDDVAVSASMVLFELSGRRFTGLCRKQVRPCRSRCGCWSGGDSLGPWYWTGGLGPGGFWRDECGQQCGCGATPQVKLSGYPVRAIVEVKIDGVVLNPAGYRLDRWRYLTRMSDPGPPVVKNYWPSCQDMTLNDDQPGTFMVDYVYGVDPPQIGRDAAAQLACQLWLACNSQPCQLPAGVERVVRQGVTIERGLLAQWFDPKKPTGLAYVDAFLRAYWSTRTGRPPAVFSPDEPEFAPRVGG